MELLVGLRKQDGHVYASLLPFGMGFGTAPETVAVGPGYVGVHGVHCLEVVGVRLAAVGASLVPDRVELPTHAPGLATEEFVCEREETESLAWTRNAQVSNCNL